MQGIINIHAADVTRLLQGLVAKDVLVRDGHGRWSRYRLPDAGDSEHNERKSTHNEGQSLHSDEKSLHNEELQRIAITAQNRKRLLPKVTEQIILELCQGRWLTRYQLSQLMARNAESLRERFLNPMVAERALMLRYPDKPNHVGQAYTATDLVKENAVSLTKPKAK